MRTGVNLARSVTGRPSAITEITPGDLVQAAFVMGLLTKFMEEGIKTRVRRTMHENFLEALGEGKEGIPYHQAITEYLNPELAESKEKIRLPLSRDVMFRVGRPVVVNKEKEEVEEPRTSTDQLIDKAQSGLRKIVSKAKKRLRRSALGLTSENTDQLSKTASSPLDILKIITFPYWFTDRTAAVKTFIGVPLAYNIGESLAAYGYDKESLHKMIETMKRYRLREKSIVRRLTKKFIELEKTRNPEFAKAIEEGLIDPEEELDKILGVSSRSESPVVVEPSSKKEDQQTKQAWSLTSLINPINWFSGLASFLTNVITLGTALGISEPIARSLRKGITRGHAAVEEVSKGISGFSPYVEVSYGPGLAALEEKLHRLEKLEKQLKEEEDSEEEDEKDNR